MLTFFISNFILEDIVNKIENLKNFIASLYIKLKKNLLNNFEKI